MPRNPRFSESDVLDAALACVGRSGRTVTIAQVAAELDGPVGSIYHRFSSREDLLSRLWLRSIGRFQAGLFVIAEHQTEPHAALVECAAHIPRYCHAHPAEARALTLYRQPVLLAECSAELRPLVEGVNRDVDALTRALTRARYGRASAAAVELVATATRVCPYGLVRPYLGRSVPPATEAAVVASTDAILRLGDRPARRRRVTACIAGGRRGYDSGMTTTPRPDAPHTGDDLPLSADGLPATEAVEGADLEKRLDEDPTSVANATAPDGEPNPDVTQTR